jgi:hypothetical protein
VTYVDLSTLYRCLKTLYSAKWRSKKRIVFGTIAFLAISAIHLINAFTRLLDEIFFPGYRSIRLTKPLLITANPRSGTTFLHRLISLDEERFASFKLRHALLSSISMTRLMDFLAPIDRSLGGPLKRLIDKAFDKGFVRWEGIHKVGFNEPEEDEALFFFLYASPAMYGVYPFFREVPSMRFADSLPERKRRALVRYYRGSVRRFLYTQGRGRTFLLKTVLLNGRVKIMHEVFPDANIVYLVRSPYDVLPSFASMFTSFWKKHSPEITDDSDLTREWIKLGVEYYRHFHDNRHLFSDSQLVVYHYDQLAENPREVVESIYRRFDIALSSRFSDRLDGALKKQRKYRSIHDYSLERYGVERDWVYRNLSEVFETYGLKR